jgi:hypothetical protein
VAENKTAGDYQLKWNGHGIPEGVYYAVLRSENYVWVCKMVLVH